MKIINLINNFLASHVSYSFEYYVPRTDEGVNLLYHCIESMKTLTPQFIDITWRVGPRAEKTLEICGKCIRYLNIETMMHIACRNLTRKQIDTILDKAQRSGITNLLVLQGDSAGEISATNNDFVHAIDLVRYIRQNWGNYFGIAVAGYPDGHSRSISIDKEIEYLKEKVDAGADFVITQLFYDVSVFVRWVEKCREVGIKCPIIPGIMPIKSYQSFRRITSLCGIRPPKRLMETLEIIKNDDNTIHNLGIDFTVEMCRNLVRTGFNHFHFYVLNHDHTIKLVIEKLGSSNIIWRPVNREDVYKNKDFPNNFRKIIVSKKQ
ncbi:MAG: methylenetetrahydrofolate reductase [Nitrososphaerota archaeon]